ncbi:hypothetical protein ABZ530_12700, partial [Micrococcus luteus]|uniref:hypothetical protein n=1 Tax=Micrococcus luteus TaxID=1270 RepID=UPI0033C04804
LSRTATPASAGSTTTASRRGSYGGKLDNDLEKLEENTPVSSLIDELAKALQNKDADLPDFYDGYQAQVVLEGLRN